MHRTLASFLSSLHLFVWLNLWLTAERNTKHISTWHCRLLVYSFPVFMSQEVPSQIGGIDLVVFLHSMAIFGWNELFGL